MDIDKYDEYHSAPPLETITVDTRINNTNKGFAMLAKLGWTEGTPLGVSGEGKSCTYSSRYTIADRLQDAWIQCRSISRTI